MPQFIQKRNGLLEIWNPEKIRVAIFKALKSSTEMNEDSNIAQASYVLLDDVVGMIEHDVTFSEKISQEVVQDFVERVLMQNGYFTSAKNFILYREKRREIRDQKFAGEDSQKIIEEYVNREDWRVNENANIDYSFQGLTLALSGYQQATYCLNKFPEEIRKAHNEGYFHIHDLSFGLAGYCAGWSLYDLILEGFNKNDACSSKPQNILILF
jgi:ribonucleoside-triphosphate reductase